MKELSVILGLIAAAFFAIAPAFGAGEGTERKSGEAVTVTGEVLDMACYIDHGAHGAKHADCAMKCIKSGLPVGMKAENGTTYLLIGDHKPMNDELAQYAAKTITVKGKAVMRDGIHMIENAEILKKP